MLGRVRRYRCFKIFKSLGFLAIVCLFASCATKKDPSLIADSEGRGDSALPWNQQQKWEGQGQLGPMAERFGTRDR